MRPDPTPFQDQRSIRTPASKRLARRRAPQPERPTYYLRTRRGDDAMWGVSPVRGVRDHGGSKPQVQRRALFWRLSALTASQLLQLCGVLGKLLIGRRRRTEDLGVHTECLPQSFWVTHELGDHALWNAQPG